MTAGNPTKIVGAGGSRQLRRLRRVLRDAASYVPMYRDLGVPRLSGDEPSLREMLSAFPVMTKTDLMSLPEEARIDLRFAGGHLIRESTTGSTGQPFSIAVDPAYLRRRNFRFLRALVSVGYRPWQRFLLLTDRYSRPTRKHLTRYYESVEQPSAAIVDAFLRIRPTVLYGFTTSLRLLRDELHRRGGLPHRPAFAVTTAEMLDTATRTSLEQGFGCPVYDFYGMTEMGLVAWQYPGSGGCYAVSDSVLVELEPIDTDGRLHRVIMTNLDLRVTPFIRYDSGDLAVVENHYGTPQITSIEGRRLDTIVLRDGSELSPYCITDALRDVPKLTRFKVVQESLDNFTVELEIEAPAYNEASNEIRRILHELTGNEVTIRFRRQATLLPNGQRKFRPVESRVERGQ